MTVQATNMVRAKNILTMVVGKDHFLWKGILLHLPKNIAEASPGVKEWFVDVLKMKDSVFYTIGVPSDKMQEFILKRAAEKIKDIPPDPLFLGIYAVAHAATMVFIVVIGCKTMARL